MNPISFQKSFTKFARLFALYVELHLKKNLN